MKDLGDLLRDADPLAHEKSLSAVEAHRMRSAIVDAARESSADVPGWWPNPMAVAATVALTLGTGVAVGHWLPRHANAARRAAGTATASTVSGTPSTSSTAAMAVSRERRQLQFATPGGTRIIWVFDSDFNP